VWAWAYGPWLGARGLCPLALALALALAALHLAHVPTPDHVISVNCAKQVEK
jgi:hypothetical protein